MGNVNVTIDGRKIKVSEGSTILEAAAANDITIPTLCHIKGQIPTGVCRVCVVEVEGSKTMMGACHTPVANGMVINTGSPRVLAVRRVIVELLLTAPFGKAVRALLVPDGVGQPLSLLRFYALHIVVLPLTVLLLSLLHFYRVRKNKGVLPYL